MGLSLELETDPRGKLCLCFQGTVFTKFIWTQSRVISSCPGQIRWVRLWSRLSRPVLLTWFGQGFMVGPHSAQGTSDEKNAVLWSQVLVESRSQGNNHMESKLPLPMPNSSVKENNIFSFQEVFHCQFIFPCWIQKLFLKMSHGCNCCLCFKGSYIEGKIIVANI